PKTKSKADVLRLPKHQARLTSRGQPENIGVSDLFSPLASLAIPSEHRNLTQGFLLESSEDSKPRVFSPGAVPAIPLK
ncbi:hypothetical protein ACLGJF_19605, partial [Acinetobacter baumannii]